MIPSLLENSVDSELLKELISHIAETPSILESGVLLGSWCININNLIQDKRPVFFGIDDLSFINNQQLFKWYKNFNIEFNTESQTDNFLKIKTPNDLENYIKERALLYTNKAIEITISENFFENNLTFDLIHHDCANDYNSNDKFYQYYSKCLRKTGLLAIDNFGCDVPMRALALSKYIENKTFYIVGSGRRKLFLTRNLDFANYLIKKIKDTDKYHSLVFTFDQHFNKWYFYHPPESKDL